MQGWVGFAYSRSIWSNFTAVVTVSVMRSWWGKAPVTDSALISAGMCHLTLGKVWWQESLAFECGFLCSTTHKHLLNWELSEACSHFLDPNWSVSKWLLTNLLRLKIWKSWKLKAMQGVSKRCDLFYMLWWEFSLREKKLCPETNVWLLWHCWADL